MTLIILLFAIGIVFIVAEVLVPGAILGSIGGLLMFAGCVVAFLRFDFLTGLGAVGAALVVAAIAFYIEFRILPRTNIGRRAFLTKEITATSVAVEKEARALIGKPAEAVTVMSPSGYVRIEGRRYEAFCQSGQAAVGSALEVIGADSFRLIVTHRSIPS